MKERFLISIRQDQADEIERKGWNLSAIAAIQIPNIINHYEQAGSIFVDSWQKRKCPNAKRTTISLEVNRKREIEIYSMNFSATMRNILDKLIASGESPYKPMFA